MFELARVNYEILAYDMIMPKIFSLDRKIEVAEMLFYSNPFKIFRLKANKQKRFLFES